MNATENMNHSPVRRSSRQRTNKSALELLGITPRNVTEVKSQDAFYIPCCTLSTENVETADENVETVMADKSDAPLSITEGNVLLYKDATDTEVRPITSDDLTKLVRSESGRAVPVHHVIMEPDLQSVIENLQPTDLIDEHVIYKPDSGNRRKRLMYCKHCNVLISHRHEFRKHVRLHPEVDYKPFQCPLCDYRAQIRAQIARHINIHSTKKPFVCTECGRGFNFKQKLQIHMKYHADVRDQQCPLCLLSFHEFKTLRKHVTKIHNISNAKEFLRNEQKQVHISGVNQTEQVGLADSERFGDGKGVIKDCSNAVCCNNVKLTDMDGSTVGRDSVSAEQECDDSINLCDTLNADSLTSSPVKLRGRRIFGIYGTCKTAIRTQKYKLGVSSALQTFSGANRQCNWQRKRRHFVNNQKFVSADQISSTLRQYCTVKSRDPDAECPDHKVLFLCTLCDSTTEFPSKTQFARHLENCHPHIRAWHCDVCNYECRLRSSLIVHSKRHSNDARHICDMCGKYFIFRKQLMTHLRQHLNKREFSCDICKKSFNEEIHVRRHIALVHRDVEKTFICEICLKSFTSEENCRRHLDKHSDVKKFQCSNCSNWYKSKASLMQHVKSHIFDFRCEICDKAFGSYSGFMSHKNMHDESKFGYKCNQCDKILHTKGSLKRHCNVVHDNARPFKCGSCSKAFKTKKDLKSHGPVHSAEKKFECRHCSFHSKRMQGLIVHMRVHDAVKPYCCHICNKEYTQKQSLDVHVSRHLGKHLSVRGERFSQCSVIKSEVDSDLLSVGCGDESPVILVENITNETTSYTMTDLCETQSGSVAEVQNEQSADDCICDIVTIEISDGDTAVVS